MEARPDKRAGKCDRRTAIKFALAAVGTLVNTSFAPIPDEQPALVRPKRLGVTVSDLQCQYLGLSPDKTLKELLTLGLDSIRLCVYWSRSEPTRGSFDFSAVRQSLEIIEKENIRRLQAGSSSITTIVAVGSIFSPSYPEYHLPGFLLQRPGGPPLGKPFDSDSETREQALEFLARSVNAVKDYPCVTTLQVGNESRNALPTAGGKYVSFEFLQTEVSLVRRLKRRDQKILIADAINIIPIPGDDQEIARQSMQIADAISTNVYGKAPIPKTRLYLQPLEEFWDRLKNRKQLARQMGTELIITEVQAEPWENQANRELTTPTAPSASPKKTQALVARLTQMGFDTQYLWGGTWWMRWKERGNLEWWEGVRELIQAPILTASEYQGLRPSPLIVNRFVQY